MKRLLYFLILSACLVNPVGGGVIPHIAQVSGRHMRGPLNLTGANIICDGNSLTYGYGVNPSTESYPALLAGMSPLSTNGATVTNFGVNAQTTPMMIADAASQVDVTYNPAVQNIVVFSEIINDAANNGGPPEDIYQNALNYWAGRTAAGFRVLVCTAHAADHDPPGAVFPSGETKAQYWATIQAVNNLILTSGDIPTEDIIRFDLVPELSDEFNSTYFQSDHLHLTVAGNLARANAVYAHLMSLHETAFEMPKRTKEEYYADFTQKRRERRASRTSPAYAVK